MFCMLYLINVFTSLVTSAVPKAVPVVARVVGPVGEVGAVRHRHPCGRWHKCSPSKHVGSRAKRGFVHGVPGTKLWKTENLLGTPKKANFEREVLSHSSAICSKWRTWWWKKHWPASLRWAGAWRYPLERLLPEDLGSIFLYQKVEPFPKDPPWWQLRSPQP